MLEAMKKLLMRLNVLWDVKRKWLIKMLKLLMMNISFIRNAFNLNAKLVNLRNLMKKHASFYANLALTKQDIKVYLIMKTTSTSVINLNVELYSILTHH